MIARPLVGADILVDDNAEIFIPKRIRNQDMVDAKTSVAPKGHHSVIPPGVRLLGLLKSAERVGEAAVEELLEGFTALRRAENAVSPGLRIPNVPGNVPVQRAASRQAL